MLLVVFLPPMAFGVWRANLELQPFLFTVEQLAQEVVECHGLAVRVTLMEVV